MFIFLKCGDGSFYTGYTENLKERFARHSKGYVDSTRHKLPVEIVFYSGFKEQKTALKFEKYLKSGSGFAFRNKHLLIESPLR